MTKQVAATGLAYRVLDLVDTSSQHARPDDENDDDEQKTAKKLQGSEDSFGLEPDTNEPVLTFAHIFSSQTFTAHKSTFLADESFEFTTIACIETTVAAFVTVLKLSLTLTVLSELRRGVGSQSRS